MIIVYRLKDINSIVEHLNGSIPRRCVVYALSDNSEKSFRGACQVRIQCGNTIDVKISQNYV